MRFTCFFIHFLCYHFSTHFITKTVASDWYTAAVVEFRPSIAFNTTSNNSDLLRENLHAYKELIFATENVNADIIVFPEGTLNDGLELTFVPSEKDAIIPCLMPVKDNIYAEFFIELSCTARQVRKYLVINLTEKEICINSKNNKQPCANTGLNIYNTNVVFDRFGRVISRYRKWHVYLEAKNVTLQPEYAIFDTDFGVRFGHFICFDILFYTPPQVLVEHFNVTDVIFTTKFYSELPFLTAVQLQQAWAWGNNVNLLAAGVSDPLKGSTGSGIYAGKYGALVAVMVTELKGHRKILTTRLPKNNKSFKIEDTMETYVARDSVPKHLRLLKDPNLQDFNSTLLKFSNYANISEGELCYGSFCCRYQINYTLINNLTSYYYRFGIFRGSRTYEKLEWNNIQVCALYTCTNENVTSCGDILDFDNYRFINFKHITIRGSFKKTNQLLIMPTSLDSDLYPLKANCVHWNKIDNGDVYEIQYNLERDCDNLLTFGIYANYYDTIPTNHSNHSKMSIICICVATLLLLSNNVSRLFKLSKTQK